MSVRPAIIEDLDAMERVEAEGMRGGWSRSQLAEELERPKARVFVAEQKGRVLGHAIAWMVAGEVHVLDVCVAPSARRRGLGRQLVGRLLELGEEALLEVRAGNTPAIGLYEGMGFERVGFRKGYYSDGEDAVLMTWRAP